MYVFSPLGEIDYFSVELRDQIGFLFKFDGSSGLAPPVFWTLRAHRGLRFTGYTRSRFLSVWLGSAGRGLCNLSPGKNQCVCPSSLYEFSTRTPIIIHSFGLEPAGV